MNAKDNYGFTALIRASEDGHIDILTLLLDKGADTTPKSIIKNCTALMSAKNKETVEVIEKHIRIQELIKKATTVSLVIKKGLTKNNEPLMRDTHKETVYNIVSFF